MSIEELKRNIAELPTGGITIKKFKDKKTGKYYEYHVYQWRENGKQKSRYLKGDEVQRLSDLIEERKKLEKLLSDAEKNKKTSYNDFFTEVWIESVLKKFTVSVHGLKKREIFNQLKDFVYGNEYNRVFILYGLRRTGKTTMIKQLIADMTEEQIKKAAYIKIKPENDLGQLNIDLRRLLDADYKYVFIDEITLMEDFIEGAAVLSDLYAATGMKLVLSGTDSLGFWISKSNELYDRCRLLHTTFIPYREFSNVLGIKSIDDYIQYGGTMSISGNHYNAFYDKTSTDEYVDSAIANNIQHSLKCYQDEGHFRHLFSLYEHGELTSAINRVVEDINHRFTVNVLTRQFKSGDLSLSARNLRKDNNILDLIDRASVTEKLRNILSIKNKPQQIVEIDEIHTKEIKEYLTALDLIKEIKISDIDNFGCYDKKIAFTQAGLRYSQAKSLIEVLLQDKMFASLPYKEIHNVSERILHEIKGRMLEDIVLIETAISNPDKDVFKLLFPDGEYDMVVFDKEKAECSIYEIKYSAIMDKNQCRHLTDKEKIKKTEFRYGNIKERCVLYRGNDELIDGIQYKNVEGYLQSL